MLNFLRTMALTGGGASSWNDLKGKPFGEETTVVNEPLNITWDGNTEGLVQAVGEMPLYKVSDLVLTDEQIKLVTVALSVGMTYSMSDEWEGYVENGMVTEDAVMPDGVAFVRKDGAEHMGMMFPKAGIYAFSGNGAYVQSITTTEPVEQTKTVVHKLDKKFLPDDVGGGAEIIEATVDADDASCLVLPITTTEIAAKIENGKDVVIKAEILDSTGKHTYNARFRFASSANSAYSFITFCPSFSMSGGQAAGACVLEVYAGEEQTTAWFNYVNES